MKKSVESVEKSGWGGGNHVKGHPPGLTKKSLNWQQRQRRRAKTEVKEMATGNGHCHSKKTSAKKQKKK